MKVNPAFRLTQGLLVRICSCHWFSLSESPHKRSTFLPCQNDVGKNCCYQRPLYDQTDPLYAWVPSFRTHFDMCMPRERMIITTFSVTHTKTSIMTPSNVGFILLTTDIGENTSAGCAGRIQMFGINPFPPCWEPHLLTGDVAGIP